MGTLSGTSIVFGRPSSAGCRMFQELTFSSCTVPPTADSAGYRGTDREVHEKVSSQKELVNAQFHVFLPGP